MKKVCRFRFAEGVGRQAVEEHLALAIAAAESLYGKARVRLGTGYLVSKDGRQLALDTSNEIGEQVARLFTGFMIREIGEEAFSTERVERNLDVADG